MNEVKMGQCVLLQAEDMGAKIVLCMPNNRKSIDWIIYHNTGIKQYKMYIGEICISINDSQEKENISKINLAFKKHKFLLEKFK